MRILITGGAGFIGSHLADRLIRNGHVVRIIDNLLTGKEENIHPETRWNVADDLQSHKRLYAEVRGFDVVIHAAASYDDNSFWTRDAFTNVYGTAQVLRHIKEHWSNMVDHRHARLIYFQTSLCYGPPQTTPITLNHPINPKTSYAITKTAAEQFIQMSGLDFVSFRLCNVYGPRNLSGPIPTFFKRLTEGKPCYVTDTYRDFVYIDDLVDIVMQAVDGRGHGVYHVSSGRDISIKEVYDTVSECLGMNVPVEVRPMGKDDVPTILLDPLETIQEFAWMPTVDLKTGIGKAVEWYKEHGVGETYTHLRMDDATTGLS